MKRSEKVEHKPFLIGAKVARFASPILIAKTGRRTMTSADYREHRMGRRNKDAETAHAQKMEKAGWVWIEGTDWYRKITRKG